MKYRDYLLILAALPILVSCGEAMTFRAVTAGLSAASYGVFTRPDVNLKEKNYAAADYMAGQIGKYVNANHTILATPLEEVDHAGISSPLGYAIPEGVGLRFIALGYHVWLHEVAANANAGLYPPPPKGEKPDFILKGTYLPKNKQVDVHLRLISTKSQQVVASFDYPLALSSEVKELSQTKTRIFRVSK